MYDDDEEEEGTAVLSARDLVGKVDDTVRPFLVFIVGGTPGRMMRLEDELVCGRSPKAAVQLSGEGISRLHTRFYREGQSTFVEDLGSTNGTLVNGRRIEAPTALADGDKIQIGATFLLKFSLQDELDQRLQQDLFDAALRDPLTDTHNRRALFDRLEADVAHANRHGDPYCLLLFDLDHFKRVNDRFGHPAGDYVLRVFAQLVGQLTRTEDFFARYGGEEFALACRSTDLVAATTLSERIRTKIEAHHFDHEGRHIPVTTSIGIARLRAPETVKALLSRADEALYEAKSAGRNRHCVRD